MEVDTREGCAYVKYDLILARSLEWKISSFFRCIGQKKHGERLGMDWNKVVGSEGRARFKHRPYTDKNGEQRVTNDVDTFYDYNPDFFSKKQTPSWVAEAEKAPTQSWEQGSF